MFLVMSACEEMWDVSKPLIFLGAHTRRFARRRIWEGLDGQVLDGPLQDPHRAREAAQYIRGLSETWLPILARNLNQIHGETHGIRYWRIVIGSWLTWGLGVAYERYTRLTAALSAFPELVTFTLTPESFTTPLDTLDFSQLLKGDTYNHQIYTEILHHLGHRFPEKTVPAKAEEFSPPYYPTRWHGAAQKLRTMSEASLRRRLFKPKILTRSLYASPRFQLGLFGLTGGGVQPVFASHWRNVRRPTDDAAREKLCDELSPQDNFERFAVAFMRRGAPQYLIEGYRNLKDASEMRYPVRPRGIISANAWIYDEPFKHWAAACAEENGTKLLGVQHGGDYGSVAEHSSERHEISISDRYFTWGWDLRGMEAKVIPAYALKLAGRRRSRPVQGGAGVLFVATQASRYPAHLDSFTLNFSEYLDWQKRFTLELPDRLRALIYVRFHAEDLGWDFVPRWKEWNPSAVVENWRVPFMESLCRRRIYICDHLSTTFIEALAADKPTLLFWNRKNTVLREDAKSYYEMLQAVGILFEDPESAARTLTRIYDDVDSWWQAPARQAARAHFCHRFGRTGAGALRNWASLLRKEMAN